MALDENDILVLKGVIQEELKNVKHVCIQEKEIGWLSEINKRIITELYGNGQEGVAKTVLKLEDKIQMQTESIVELKSAVSGILKFVNETTGQGKADETRKQKIVRRAKVVGAVVAVLAFLFTLIVGYNDLKKDIEQTEGVKIESNK